MLSWLASCVCSDAHRLLISKFRRGMLLNRCLASKLEYSELLANEQRAGVSPTEFNSYRDTRGSDDTTTDIM